MPWRIFEAFKMHVIVNNCYFLRSFTFFANWNLLIVSLLQLVELLFLSDKKEPSSINSFLEPIVKELQVLWRGVKLDSSFLNGSSIFRAALLCVSCDIPPARKCCGFKSHAARLGCHKCVKEFQGDFGEKRDYSDFCRQN